MSDTLSANDVHAAVQQRYGRLAESGQSCCSDGACYQSDLSEVPADIAEFSLGCGDPISIAELQAGEVVLDLGSGGGLDAFLAAQRVQANGKVIGVDMTPAMIERAEASRQRLGLENVEFRLGQIEALPVEDASVDVILSNCVINLVPDKKAVFAEAFRVLKSGGRLAVADLVSDGELSEAERADFDAWAECLSGAIPEARYLGYLREVGFQKVEITHRRRYEETRQLSAPIYSVRVVAYKA